MQVQETQTKTYHTVSLANVVTPEFLVKMLNLYGVKSNPLLEKALDETYTIDDIYKGLIEDRMQLFISWNDERVESAVVTEIAQYPQSKVLRYFLAGGVNLENWLERIQKVIEKFARKENCTHIEVAGRKGWVRKLKGFRVKAYLLNKEI